MRMREIIFNYYVYFIMTIYVKQIYTKILIYKDMYERVVKNAEPESNSILQLEQKTGKLFRCININLKYAYHIII